MDSSRVLLKKGFTPLLHELSELKNILSVCSLAAVHTEGIYLILEGWDGKGK